MELSNNLNENYKKNQNNCNHLIKISPDILFQNLKIRGYDFDDKLCNKLYELNMEYINNNYQSLNIDKLCDKYDIHINLKDTIQLLINLDNYNINYIYYVLILNSLDIQQIKNLYRYLMIKWDKFKKNNLNSIDTIINFTFIDKINLIRLETDYQEIYQLFINKIKEFIDMNDNKTINIYLFFFINTLQEYLYPI